MVPFGMRILHAELPHYLGRSHEALDRLYYILAVAQKVSIVKYSTNSKKQTDLATKVK